MGPRFRHQPLFSEPNALEAVFTTQSIGRWHHRAGSEDVRGEALRSVHDEQPLPHAARTQECSTSRKLHAVRRPKHLG